jgi:hypothetical protein
MGAYAPLRAERSVPIDENSSALIEIEKAA